MPELILNLPQAVIKRLQAHAKNRKTTVEALAQEALQKTAAVSINAERDRTMLFINNAMDIIRTYPPGKEFVSKDFWPQELDLRLYPNYGRWFATIVKREGLCSHIRYGRPHTIYTR